MSDDNARLLLQQKVREIIAECDIPALGAVLVRILVTQPAPGLPFHETPVRIAAQDGIRKVGAEGPGNQIQPDDRFNIGSITKIFTATLIGHLVDQRMLRWDSRLIDLMPELSSVPGYQHGYDEITVEQLLTHSAGMPYQPSGDDAQAYLHYTASDMSPAGIMANRRAYTRAAVRDPLLYSPGAGCVYGGGGIICAHVAERLVGTVPYEDLVGYHLYKPLGMAHSGFGRMSHGALDGPWQHRWSGETFSLVPDQDSMRPAADWHPRNPVGGACCSADDLGKFLTEQVRLSPQATTADTRATMHAQICTPAFTRGAWGASVKPAAVHDIAYDGDNGLSYASVEVTLDRRVAVGAMANVNGLFAVPAIAKAKEVARFMDANWDTLFADPNDPPVECVHPRPSFFAAGARQFVAVRRCNGRVVLLQSDHGGAWSANPSLPGFVATSGLAGAASADGQRVILVARGTDRRLYAVISTDGGTHWPRWARVANGLFTSGPSLAMSSDGNLIHVGGIGDDRRMYRTRLLHLGPAWEDWTPIGQGLFTASPALACSVNGTVLHVAGRGLDHRLWINRSLDGGTSFAPSWRALGAGVFISSPAAAASPDGATLHLAGRGTDRALWRNTSTDMGNHWLPHWQPIPVGAFNSAPDLDLAADGHTLTLLALGTDFRPMLSRSIDAGTQWSSPTAVGSQAFV